MKKRMLKNGFTIAELLITMLIVLVVSAAIVPFIGPKKIKHPRELANHGLFECYWKLDNNVYKLMQYTRAGKNSGIESDSDAVEVTGEGKTNGYCTFNVPKANFFKVEMVGKGGDGYGSNFTTPQQFADNQIGYSIIDANSSIMPGNYTYSGTIPTLPDSYSSNGVGFESYMGYPYGNGKVDSLNIPGLRNYYDSVGPLRAAYLAKIPASSNDDGTNTDNTPSPEKDPHFNNTTAGIFLLPVYAETTMPDGRYSIFLSWLGKNNKLSFSSLESPRGYKISQNNKVYNFMSVSGDSESIGDTHSSWKNIYQSLQDESNTAFCKARSGSGPNINEVLEKFKNMEPSKSKSYFCASSPATTPTDWGIEPIALDNSSGNGTVSSDGIATGFDYKITLPALQYTYGAGGNSAEIAVQIYPKFQAEQIRVYPAKNGGETKIVTVSSDGEKTLIRSSNGTDGEKQQNIMIKAVDNNGQQGIEWLENIKNLPSILTESVFVKSGPDMGAVFNNIHGKNPLQDSIDDYKSSGGTSGTMSPGTGGNGAYKMVNKVNGQTTIELYDSLGVNHGDSTNGISWNKDFSFLEEKCTVPGGYSGFVKDVIKSNNSNDWYCKGTKGAPGAVVITW